LYLVKIKYGSGIKITETLRIDLFFSFSQLHELSDLERVEPLFLSEHSSIFQELFFFSTNLSIKAKSSSTLFLIILWEVLFSNILAFASDNGRWYM